MKKIFLLALVPLIFMSFSWRWQDKKNSHDIYYIEKGHGNKHVLLLHGYCANTYTWKEQIDVLAKNGYHVWALDLIGFGKSAKPENISYSLALYEKQIAAFISAHHIAPVNIIAHSMGGYISLNFALKYPQYVRSLVLIDSAGYPLRMPKVLAGCPEYLLRLLICETTLRLALKKMFYNEAHITDERVAAYWQPLQSSDAKNSAVKVLSLWDNDMFARNTTYYSNIIIPTLLIWGEKDKLISLKHCERFKKEIPHARVVVIPEAGHVPHEEKPALVNQAILSFLKEVS